MEPVVRIRTKLSHGSTAFRALFEMGESAICAIASKRNENIYTVNGSYLVVSIMVSGASRNEHPRDKRVADLVLGLAEIEWEAIKKQVLVGYYRRSSQHAWVRHMDSLRVA